MRRLLLLGLVLAASCDDAEGPMKNDGPAIVMDGGADAASGGGADVAPPNPAPLRLERPTDLPRPPIDRLPPDLFPPGV